ncbi:TlpA disulfide reductase family protein [Fulvivirga sediminis]|uniref:AhpC/TSA family protein n=1 Tax=Fulvivirga sediminis TaxID=2803949 RepID=A0A937F977_9BACT|nr:TlpA disulfide reductase family protein [Fulvivirga sediminis]MBL3658802.1 AhpC/TSA family protein [Fulvivirga sediminis]
MLQIKGLVILIFSILFSEDLLSQNITCKITGQISGRDSESLILVKAQEDARHNGVKIPIVDNRFNYELKAENIEKYQLIFEDELLEGAFRPIDFFPENGTIQFDLHSFDEFENNEVTGGQLTSKMVDFEKQRKDTFQPKIRPIELAMDSLKGEGLVLNEKAKLLLSAAENSENPDDKNRLFVEFRTLMKNNEGYSKEALGYKMRIDSVHKEILDWQNEYIESNPDIFSYSLLLETFQRKQSLKNKVDMSILIKLYSMFAHKYPSHPYTNQIYEIIEAINTIEVGGRYIDFNANTLEGESVRISEVIKGKIAVIDLWASWCSPCRRLSLSMIPVYEKYKDKGFLIVGVGREYNNAEKFTVAIEKDKYPWLNLIELDDENGIWNKYNIGNAAGCTYLVDKNGEILAIHPTAQEIDNILKEIYK